MTVQPAASGRTKPGAARGTDEARERVTLATALDALATAVDLVHEQLRSASPATRALIAEHASWPENFLWTDGSQVALAARRIAALLREHTDPSLAPAPRRVRERKTRDR